MWKSFRLRVIEADMSKPSIKPIDDEWWTTAMVCAHLKLGKRALWDIRRDSVKRFPEAIKPGGKVNLFRASDVRGWMDRRFAAASKPTDGIAAPEIVDTATPITLARANQPKPAHVADLAAPARRRRKGVNGGIDVRQLELF